MTAPATSIIDGTIPAFVQVGGGLDTQLTPPAVILVAREQGVHRGDVELVLFTPELDRVLDEGVQTQHDIFETLDVLDLFDEVVHRPLTLRQFHLSVLVPEGLASHTGIRLSDLRTLALEEFLRQLVERVVCQSGGTDDDTFLDELGELQLGDHVVFRQYPVTVVQLLELLLDPHVLHEVHRRLLGQCQLTAAHMVGRVFQDVDIPSETEVHLVVRQEVQVYHTVALYLQGVLDIEAVEGDGILTDR